MQHLFWRLPEVCHNLNGLPACFDRALVLLEIWSFKFQFLVLGVRAFGWLRWHTPRSEGQRQLAYAGRRRRNEERQTQTEIEMSKFQYI